MLFGCIQTEGVIRRGRRAAVVQTLVAENKLWCVEIEIGKG